LRRCVECALSLNGEALKNDRFYAENRGELNVLCELQLKTACGFAADCGGVG
jgi:hypothetical protein